MSLVRLHQSLRALAAASGSAPATAMEDVLHAIADYAGPLAAMGTADQRDIGTLAAAALRKLSDARRPDAVCMLAEALVAAGLDDAEVKLWMVQGLVDQGRPALALLSIRGLPPVMPRSTAEPDDIRKAAYLEGIRHGLKGRVLKDLAVSWGPTSETGRQAALDAIRAYGECGMPRTGATASRNRANARWGATNVLGLRRWLGDAAPGEIEGLAAEVSRHSAGPGPVERWDFAALFEAALARGDEDAATRNLEAYLKALPSAFELGGTLRQLEGLLRASGGQANTLEAMSADRVRLALVETPGGGFGGRVEAFERLEGTFQARALRAEAAYGTASVTASFLDALLGRRGGVCRIDRGAYGAVFATGFVVNAKDLVRSSCLPDEPMILTCSHSVASVDYRRRGHRNVLPMDARARFTAQPGAPNGDVREVWHSPPDELDATLLRIVDPALRAAAGAWTLEVDLDRYRQAEASELRDGAERGRLFPSSTYVIGHPMGSDDLRFSLSNNALLGYGRRGDRDADGWVMRYRTPTEIGSSGSPVFDGDRLSVVGLHHAADAAADLPGWRDAGPANEAICLRSISDAIRSGALDADALEMP